MIKVKFNYPYAYKKEHIQGQNNEAIVAAMELECSKSGYYFRNGDKHVLGRVVFRVENTILSFDRDSSETVLDVFFETHSGYEASKLSKEEIALALDGAPSEFFHYKTGQSKYSEHWKQSMSTALFNSLRTIEHQYKEANRGRLSIGDFQDKIEWQEFRTAFLRTRGAGRKSLKYFVDVLADLGVIELEEPA